MRQLFFVLHSDNENNGVTEMKKKKPDAIFDIDSQVKRHYKLFEVTKDFEDCERFQEVFEKHLNDTCGPVLEVINFYAFFSVSCLAKYLAALVFP